jgi:Mrp family chromosome partitioning ATPase
MALSRSGHNLDFMIEKDSVGFGCEIKLAMRIIAIANQKDGAGKTTSTIKIGAGFTQLGERVTIFDYKR